MYTSKPKRYGGHDSRRHPRNVSQFKLYRPGRLDHLHCLQTITWDGSIQFQPPVPTFSPFFPAPNVHSSFPVPHNNPFSNAEQNANPQSTSKALIKWQPPISNTISLNPRNSSA